MRLVAVKLPNGTTWNFYHKDMFQLRDCLMNRPNCLLMRSLSTAHFIHNKFPFFFNNMFIINISVVRPTRKGKEDYLADLARNKGTEVQKPCVVDSKFYLQATK